MQVGLRELRTICVPSTKRVGVSVGLVEIVLLARIDQAVDGNAQIGFKFALNLGHVFPDGCAAARLRRAGPL